MIGRVWHGWTSPEAADAYETLLRTEVLPSFRELPGYRGAHVLRRVGGEGPEGEVEFVTLTWFDDMEAVKAFSHDGERGAVVPAAARELLARFDARSAHYEVVLEPGEEG